MRSRADNGGRGLDQEATKQRLVGMTTPGRCFRRMQRIAGDIEVDHRLYGLNSGGLDAGRFRYFREVCL